MAPVAVESDGWAATYAPIAESAWVMPLIEAASADALDGDDFPADANVDGWYESGVAPEDPTRSV